MSDSGEGKSALLKIETSDITSEISVVDENLNIVRQDSGNYLEVDLPFGIYKIRAKVGFQTEEKFVILDKADIETVRFSPLPVSSAIPFTVFRNSSSDRYIVNSRADKPTVHLRYGKGSTFYIYVRAGAEISVSDMKSGSGNLAEGLSLRTAEGEILTDFSQSGENRSFEKGLQPFPWFACNISVNPGQYILRLDLSDNTCIEQPLVASPRWQTQVFLPCRNYHENNSENNVVRADITNAAFFMTRSDSGYAVPGAEIRLNELMRVSLQHGQKIVPQPVRKILEGKWYYPMFGIYGAHLLLSEEEPDIKLFGAVVERLRQLLGDDHPDVEALSLKTDARQKDYIFNIPPVLKHSWAIVVAETASQPWLVPAESQSAGISTDLWGQEPLLQWKIRIYPKEERFPESQYNSINFSTYMSYLKHYLSDLKFLLPARRNIYDSADVEKKDQLSEITGRNKNTSLADYLSALSEYILSFNNYSAYEYEDHDLEPGYYVLVMTDIISKTGLPRSVIEQILLYIQQGR